MTYPQLRPQVPVRVPVVDPVQATAEYAAAYARYAETWPPEQAAEAALRAARKALRPDAYAVVACTLVFGVFGVVSAARRSVRAQALALPVRSYWIAYLGTMAAWLGLFLVVNGPIAA